MDLITARHNAGMTLDDALFAMRTALPKPLWISRSTFSRIEHDALHASKYLPQIGTMCKIYGIEPTELDGDLGTYFDMVITMKRCSTVAA